MGNWFDSLPDEIMNTIIKLKIQLPDKVIEYDFRPDVAPDYDQLESQLEDTPQQFTFWSVVFAEQKARVAILERELLMAKSRAERMVSQEMRKHDVKLGRPEINAMIELHDAVHKTSCQVIEEEKKLSKLKAIVEAIKMKNDNVRSLAGFKREERKES